MLGLLKMFITTIQKNKKNIVEQTLILVSYNIAYSEHLTEC